MKTEEIRCDGGEIDIADVMARLWERRRFVLRVALICALAGAAAALFSPVKYTSRCVMVPQAGKSLKNNGLSGLAAMAGIDMDAGGRDDVLSPTVYPRIIASVPFQRELMQLPVTFAGYDRPVALIDYYTATEYRKFSPGRFLVKYTVGLPGLIMTAVRGKREQVPRQHDGIGVLTERESECMDILSEQLSLAINEKEGYLSLTATMPEAPASAQVAYAAQQMLQRYITEFKVQKVRAMLDFFEERCAEALKDFEARQQALASFRDANRNVVTHSARIRGERLANEYDLAFSVYSDLARQREQARIQLRETTPVFTIVEPVTVPIERSAPKRGMMVAVFLFAGLLAAAGLVFALPAAAGISNAKWLDGWRKEPAKE